MEERRSTIRVGHSCRAQCCPADDLLPQEGRALNLSERGVGLLTREPRRVGERMTVNIPLPGEEGLITASGIVRWSGSPIPSGRWHPTGLEWLPLEETAFHRLESFLRPRTLAGASRIRSQEDSSDRSLIRGILVKAGLLFAFLLAVSFGYWTLSLQQKNRRLNTAVQQRNVMIQQLEEREKGLADELVSTKTQLATASGIMTQLNQQTQRLEGDVQRLGQNVALVQASYVQLRGEREELMQRLLDLEQERAVLLRRLSSVPELRVAIREAIEARRRAQRKPSRVRAEARGEAPSRAEGNHGYLIQGGRRTGSQTVWVRVLEPRSALAIDPPGPATPQTAP